MNVVGNPKRPNTKAATEAAAKVHRKYKTADELQAKINDYFAKIDVDGAVATEHGLARHLGIALQTLQKWYDGDDCADLKETVQAAYNEMADRYQQLILRGEKNLVSFAIFMLKQKRFGGYQDRIDTKNEASVQINFGSNMDKKDFE